LLVRARFIGVAAALAYLTACGSVHLSGGALKPTPSVVASPFVKPNPTAGPSFTTPPSPTPTSTPFATWVARRVLLNGQVYYGMALDSSAVFALYTPPSSNIHDVSKVVLARIDRTTGSVLTNGPFPGGIELVRVGSGLWVVGGMSGGPTVDKYWMDLVDPITLQVKIRDWVPGRPGVDLFTLPQLTGSTDSLWLAYGAGLYQLDPSTGTIISTINVSGTLTSASLDSSGKRLYVGLVPPSSSSWQAQVFEFDAHTGARLASAPTGGADLGGPHVAAAVNGVWVTYATGMLGQVEHRDSTSLSLLPIRSQVEHTNSIDAVVGGNSVWFIDQMAEQLACADAETGSIITSVSGVPLPFALVADTRGTYVAASNGVDFLQTSACLP
jgi:hypothetical protein